MTASAATTFRRLLERSHLDHIGLVAVGGAAGAAARYGLWLLHPYEPGTFPTIVLIENIAGAFLLGVVATLLLERARPSRRLHPLLATGLLGSLTTFSNLSVDLVHLVEAGRPEVALGYAASSLSLGVLAVSVGIVLTRAIRRTVGGHDR